MFEGNVRTIRSWDISLLTKNVKLQTAKREESRDHQINWDALRWCLWQSVWQISSYLPNIWTHWLLVVQEGKSRDQQRHWHTLCLWPSIGKISSYFHMWTYWPTGGSAGEVKGSVKSWESPYFAETMNVCKRVQGNPSVWCRNISVWAAVLDWLMKINKRFSCK